MEMNRGTDGLITSARFSLFSVESHCYTDF